MVKKIRRAHAGARHKEVIQVHIFPLFLEPFPLRAFHLLVWFLKPHLSLLSNSLPALPSLAATTGRAAAPFVLSSSSPAGDDWASGGVVCPVFAQPFAGDERILQVCPPLLFPSSVRDGGPQTLTKLFVFGSESSYNILTTNFDFVCKNYRVCMCTPMSYAGSAPDLD